MAIESSAIFNIVFIGAGAVNFGGPKVPWDHSKRLESIPGVCFLAISDIDEKKAKSILDQKLLSPNAEKYSKCVIFKDWREMITTLASSINAVYIGIPPFAHGKLEPGFDVELQCLKFGLNVFVEKPLSLHPVEEVRAYNQEVNIQLSENKSFLSVGYMFRYHPAVLKAKEVLVNHNQPFLMINARYNCAYASVDNPIWWNTKLYGGHMIEQATHFVDLMRFFGGNIDLSSIRTKFIPAGVKKGDIGYLSNIPKTVNENDVPIEYRPQRVTVSSFYYDTGAIGILTHGLVLQGENYETSIDMWCDGLRISLEEPYMSDICKLRVRQGNTDDEQVYTFPNADCYYEEDMKFVTAIRNKDSSLIQSTYADAFQTYELTWAIKQSTIIDDSAAKIQ